MRVNPMVMGQGGVGLFETISSTILKAVAMGLSAENNHRREN